MSALIYLDGKFSAWMIGGSLFGVCFSLMDLVGLRYPIVTTLFQLLCDDIANVTLPSILHPLVRRGIIGGVLGAILFLTGHYIVR